MYKFYHVGVIRINSFLQLRQKNCCRKLIEALLNIKIAEIVFIEAEAVSQQDPADPQTRFDLLVTDTEGRCYDVEMQARSEGSCRDLWDRAPRYFNTLERRQYQLLGSGKERRRRNGTYVIFLCGFDPVGQDRCVYHYPWRGPHKECTTEKWAYEDHIVFLNAEGRHDKVRDDVREFADYMCSGRATGKLTQMMAATIEELKEN